MENGESKNCFFLKFSTVWNVSKYGFFSGIHFPTFGLIARKCGPEKTPYSNTFHAVLISSLISDYGLMRNNFKWLFVTFFSSVYIEQSPREIFFPSIFRSCTFNLIIMKIGYIKMYYSEVQFDKPCQKK